MPVDTKEIDAALVWLISSELEASVKNVEILCVAMDSCGSCYLDCFGTLLETSDKYRI